LLLDGLFGYPSPLNIKLCGPQKIFGDVEAVTKIFLMQIPTKFSGSFNP
jgi:hypothetical protein